MAAHDSLILPTPDQFPAFPYDPPYSIQTDLMRHVYSSIEKKHVSIVESPTGTGKTLSLLCASLTWLADEQQRARKGKISQQEASGRKPTWVASQAMQMRQRDLEAQDREYEERLMRARKAEEKLRAMARARATKRQRLAASVSRDAEDIEDSFLPDDPDVTDDLDNISPAVRALMAKVEKGCGGRPWSEGEEPMCTKVYYASRTHSQLTQVLPELRKLKFSRVLCRTLETGFRPDGATTLRRRKHEDDSAEMDDLASQQRQWRTVALGSRKQLCINQNIRSKPGDLDEKCRELQEGKGGKRCPYLPLPGEGTRMLDLRDQILASPKDIEDLAAAGKNADTCPYYGSRKAIPQAELVTLPYNLLLQKSAREALGIDLTNQIVIIDEAHNLIPTLLSLSSVSVTSNILSASLRQVEVYYHKFRTRLSVVHSLQLRRLISYLNAMIKVMEEKRGQTEARSEVMSIPDYMQKLGQKVDGINLLEIESYLKKSKIARKISGYAEVLSAAGQQGMHRFATKACLPLQVVEAFMLSLTGAREDGRIIFSSTGSDGKFETEMKYVLLNPSTTFRDIVESARSVILAGGTMSPMSDVIAQLFTFLPSERITTFSCGHIVPQSHVQTLIVSKGPSGSLLEFKYAQQSNTQILKELGQTIINLCGVVPRGMVVFFPSYSFMDAARRVWGAAHILEKFSVKKKVFWEPVESSTVELTLRDYAEAARCCASDKRAGALLFAVVGAKLAEGLNFSDDLARAVVVIGLPFANRNSPELQERMHYANQIQENRGHKKSLGMRDAGVELYENMCMNAVNQSIGLAIRHCSDWASLVLLDYRYTSKHIQSKLPLWIQNRVMVCDTFGQTVKWLALFYQEKKQKK
ncbi:DNA repair helicase [Scleroderma citrinum]